MKKIEQVKEDELKEILNRLESRLKREEESPNKDLDYIIFWKRMALDIEAEIEKIKKQGNKHTVV